jgi:Xaa-Pro aminopeptidase
VYFIPALIDKWKSEKINTDFIDFEKLDAYRDFGGIRLEDDVLVTSSGSEIIGERIPIEPDKIEEIISK